MRAAPLFAALVLLLGNCANLCADTAPDWHVTDPAARAFCLRSPFAHGYMHGYEQGFHAGDLDFQMAHDARDPAKIKAFQDPAGYQKTFGDKHSFEAGYHEGFRVGYADSYTGRQFRAVKELNSAAVGLDQVADGQSSRMFDEGVAAGYSVGRQQGLRDARASVAFQTAPIRCRGGIFHPLRHGDEYCDGYGRGYRVGYADGYANQAPKSLAQRKSLR